MLDNNFPKLYILFYPFMKVCKDLLQVLHILSFFEGLPDIVKPLTPPISLQTLVITIYCFGEL